MRTCKVCQDEFTMEKFTPILKNGKVYYSHTCKYCRNDLLYRNNQSRLAREKNRFFNRLLSWPVPQ